MEKSGIIIYFFLLLFFFLLLLLRTKPKKEEEVENEEEIEVGDLEERDIKFTEIIEEAPPEDASQEVKEQFEWNQKVRTVNKKMGEISSGTLKAINFVYLDRLICVRGKNHPIAKYVPSKSSQLSYSGVFIYDTTKLHDNTLYLWSGPQATENLYNLGEKLLESMSQETPKARLIRMKGDCESDNFRHMIHEIGGHIGQIQKAENYGDEMFFEKCFYTTDLHIFQFKDNEQAELSEIKQPSLDLLPENGAAIIDCSDNALYLYLDHVEAQNEQENNDQIKALVWMNEQKEYRTRDILIFDKGSIPPNLKIIFHAHD